MVQKGPNITHKRTLFIGSQNGSDTTTEHLNFQNIRGDNPPTPSYYKKKHDSITKGSKTKLIIVCCILLVTFDRVSQAPVH